ncbi:MAG: SpoIIE family protein phosphatase [Mycobacterium sp.]
MSPQKVGAQRSRRAAVIVRDPQYWAQATRLFAVVFLAFATGAVLSWESFGSTVGPSFFYPSAGVTAAAMMLSRRALWPAIVAAVIFAELLVDTVYGNIPMLSVVFATANVVEPIVGASVVLAWCGGRPDLRLRRDFVAFIAGACLVAPIFGALIGGTGSWYFNGLPWLSAVLTWWSGDALGILVMASPILLWTTQSYIVRRRPWETAGVLAVTAALSIASFWTEAPPSMLILPALAWAAFRLDMIGAAMAGAVAAVLANIMTTRGWGLFRSAHVSQETRVILTQAFVATIVVVAMLIGQEAGARLRAVREREAERRERKRVETLSRLAHQLFAALTPADIGRALEDQVLNEAGATALNLGLVSADSRKLEWVTMAGYPPEVLLEYGDGMELSDRTVATDVVRTGHPIMIRTAAEYASSYPDKLLWLQLSGAESVVGYPLTSGGKPFGALVLVWSDPQPMDSAQLAYISAVATMVSQALVRARVYVDEHARAAVLHSVAQPVAPVDAVGLEYRALYQPADAAHGLGGDWYSVLSLPDRRTYLSVGDVIGHGLPSVEDMAQLRSTGDAYAHQGLGPAQVLTELNRFATHQLRGEFASTLVMVFDPLSSTLTYSSAGHLPALLRRTTTGEVIRLAHAQGSLLGPFDDSVYVQCTVSVVPGDVLVMYTDGLVEHHDEGLRAGISHLEQVIEAWPPDALLDCDALAQDVAPAPHEDDLCLLVVRFGTGPGHTG